MAAQEQARVDFCDSAPSAATAVGIFAGEWSSRLPPPYDELSGGTADDLFDDARIYWGVEHLGSVAGKRVLELGPLEGGHTYLLDKLGAREITSVEGNTRAYLKCLVVKELLGLGSARFLYGDFNKYLENENAAQAERWDLGLVIGVLYHQDDPVSLLVAAGRMCNQLLIWTHYYDEAISARQEIAAKFSSSKEQERYGFHHTLYRYEYGPALELKGFCGGMRASASWMRKDEILACLGHMGFEVRGVGFDTLEHPNGPAFCVAASRIT